MRAKKIKKVLRKISKKGKSFAKKVWNDPLTQEYVQKQKKLVKATLRKAIRRVEKKIK